MPNKMVAMIVMLMLLAAACSLPGQVATPLAEITLPATTEAVIEETPPSASPTGIPVEPSATPQPPQVTAEGFLLSPSNGPDRWLLYDSPNWVTTLLYDGRNMWAGSQSGGLVQWEPQALASIRHTHASGFPLGTVNDLAFDPPSGTVYAVGDAGLAIWDGSHWEHRQAEQLGFEAGNPLTAVAVEAGTVIWVGAAEVFDGAGFDVEMPAGHGGGLARGDWLANTWEHWRAPDPLMSNQINDLAFDQNGTLWVACGHYGIEPTPGGVSRRDSAGNWYHYGLDHGADGFQLDRGLDGYAFGSLVISPEGRVYAASRRGVSWLEAGEDTWQAVSVWDARQMALDEQGRLWLAAREGLFRLDAAGLQRVHFETDYDNYQAVAMDEEGGIWFGGENGLRELQDDTVETRRVEGALPGLGVTDVAVNGGEAMWVRSGGVVSRISGGYITHFAEESLAIEAAFPWTGGEALWSVAPDGTIWYLVEGVLWGYNDAGWQTVALSAELDPYMLSYTAGAEGLFIVSAGNGLGIYQPGLGWRVEIWPHGGYQAMQSLVLDAGRNVLWGSNAYSYFFPGLAMCYRLDTQTFTYFDEANGGFLGVPPEGISLSPAGEVWLVTTSGVLAVYQEDGTWRSVVQSADFLGAAGFGEIYFGNAGELWLTTVDACGFEAVCTSGLAYFDGTDWLYFTAASSGLTSDWIFDLAVDAVGNAWLATSAGLQMAPAP